MKTKKMFLLTSAIFMALLLSITAIAQQTQVLPARMPQTILPDNDGVGSYSFKLYNVPNKMYGYDIYKDGKPVFHQFVLLYISKEGKRIVANKLQAQKAASMAIKKIKNGQPPFLSGEELKKIVAL